MSGQRSPHPDSLLLIAATTILVLGALRYFQTKPIREPLPELETSAVADGRRLARERSRTGRRHSGNPLQIPWLAGRSFCGAPMFDPVRTG